jgi:hypothetical protein
MSEFAEELLMNDLENDADKSFPYTVFVVELDDFILITGFPIEICIFPCYRFDGDGNAAFDAADDIAKQCNKLVVDAVNFDIDNPQIYDPAKIDIKMKELMETLGM